MQKTFALFSASTASSSQLLGALVLGDLIPSFGPHTHQHMHGWCLYRHTGRHTYTHKIQINESLKREKQESTIEVYEREAKRKQTFVIRVLIREVFADFKCCFMKQFQE